MDFKFSLRTRIMYFFELTIDLLRDITMLFLAFTLWCVIYGIYFSSGIKIMLELNREWKEQMKVIT